MQTAKYDQRDSRCATDPNDVADLKTDVEEAEENELHKTPRQGNGEHDAMCTSAQRRLSSSQASAVND
jgi:hypothetical protein